MTRNRKIRTKRNCASPSSKAPQGTTETDTQYWRLLKNKINVSSALITSQVRNCLGPKFVKLENKNWNICSISEYTRKLTNVKQLHSIRSLQLTRSGWTQAQQSRESHAKEVTNCGKRIQKRTSTRSVCWDSSIGSVEGNNPFPQRTTSKHLERCTSTCHVRIFTQRLRDVCWHVCRWKTDLASTLENLDG